ncbi:ferredoxin-NADP+ reductase [Nitzschia inconspicua]|uniref:ferredoxin--NADP(+) reductase n=1 Tax=Nitzschia inconspicua TaxID=303405 RepID=A0A9K3LSD7_9STRA|nr:ferredoxin-NADP+ reductase [Nitzschia inconspicua]KAG7367113.1 ferredoxin-NADP+ reductase [Nitzschia inconspicua]
MTNLRSFLCLFLSVVFLLDGSKAFQQTASRWSNIGRGILGSPSISKSSATSPDLSVSSFLDVYPGTNPIPDKEQNGSRFSVKDSLGKIVRRSAVALVTLALFSNPAFAAKKVAKETVEHLHTGQKIANFFMQFGLPKWAVLSAISAMPVVELRGAIPVGIWMGMPLYQVFLICVLGNMAPIIPILFILKNEYLKKLMSPILKRAEKKASGLGVGSLEKQWVSLAAFVGIPLPGTGAWTGAMGAFLLGMPTALAISSIFAGVLAAGTIMSAITLAGRTGGLIAISVLLAFAAKELMFKDSDIAKQSFLEANPYWDQSTVPVNTYKNKAPFNGKVVSTKRIVGPKATGETCHIIIDHKGDFPFWEGQSWGVIPPGVREKDGKPHSVRLYSIASSRYGDDMSGRTGSLCVRRATYWDPVLKADDPAKKGICSNFLCDTRTGDDVQMTGPAGKVMLLPEEDPKTDYIMVATGTGIAPYRGFIRRLFVEDTPAAQAYKGQAWLFLGVANSDALLYDDEWQEIKKEYPDQFRLDYALSREQTNKAGGKMYIQDKVEEYADEIFDKLENGAHIYFCGLKGMMPGIQDMLKKVAESKGLDYDDWLKGLKAKKQWHVEVY